MAQLFARKNANALKKNPLNLGDSDKFLIVKSIPAGTPLNVVRYENISLGRGIKKYAVLSDGLYVDADFIASEINLNEDERPIVEKKKEKNNSWIFFLVGAVIVGGVYLGGRRLFRKR